MFALCCATRPVFCCCQEVSCPCSGCCNGVSYHGLARLCVAAVVTKLYDTVVRQCLSWLMPQTRRQSPNHQHCLSICPSAGTSCLQQLLSQATKQMQVLAVDALQLGHVLLLHHSSRGHQHGRDCMSSSSMIYETLRRLCACGCPRGHVRPSCTALCCNKVP